ncbi:hypothetical protein, partial [Paracraurococcus lichenis]
MISGVASAAGRPAVRAVDAAQGVVDRRMIGGEGLVGQAVVLADGGEPLGARRGRQRDAATQVAPLGKGLPAGLVGAQRRRGARGAGRSAMAGFQQLAAIVGKRGKTCGSQAGWQRLRTRSGRYGMTL